MMHSNPRKPVVIESVCPRTESPGRDSKRGTSTYAALALPIAILAPQAENAGTRALAAVQGLPPIDLLGLGIVGVLILLGLWRGLWWQVIRFVGLVAAVATARVLSPEAAEWLRESWQDLSPRVSHGIAWGTIFLLTLGAASLLGMLGQKILETIKLGILNRLAGAFLGALTGVVVHVALLVFLCQLAPEAFVTKHVSGSRSEELLARTGSRWRIVLGAEASDEIDRVLGTKSILGLTVEPPASRQAAEDEAASQQER